MTDPVFAGSGERLFPPYIVTASSNVMQPVDTSRSGELRRVSRYYDPISGNQTGYENVAQWSGSVLTHKVSPGIMVKGDFHHPNPWSYTVRFRWTDNMSASYRTTAPPYGKVTKFETYNGPYLGIPDGLADRHTAMQSGTYADAYADLISNIRGDLDVAIDLMQTSQTAKLAVDIERSLLRVMEAMRAARKPTKADLHRRFWGLKGRKRRKAIREFWKERNSVDLSKELIKQTGNGWLIFQYGVKPTLQTIHDSITEMSNTLVSDGHLVKGKARKRADYKRTGTNWPDAGWPKWTADIRSVYTCELGVVLRIPADSLASTARFASLNPASWAWELTPWSFVIDWFVNVGDYLRNVESRLIYGRYFQSGYVSQGFKVQADINTNRSGSPWWDSNSTWDGTYGAHGVDKGFTRSLLGSFPSVPALQVRPELGSGRLLNAAALLTTFLK